MSIIISKNRYQKRVKNTLVCVLKALRGRTLVIELRNETIVSGYLDSVDAFMKYDIVCVCVCVCVCVRVCVCACVCTRERETQR